MDVFACELWLWLIKELFRFFYAFMKVTDSILGLGNVYMENAAGTDNEMELSFTFLGISTMLWGTFVIGVLLVAILGIACLVRNRILYKTGTGAIVKKLCMSLFTTFVVLLFTNLATLVTCELFRVLTQSCWIDSLFSGLLSLVVVLDGSIEGDKIAVVDSFRVNWLCVLIATIAVIVYISILAIKMGRNMCGAIFSNLLLPFEMALIPFDDGRHVERWTNIYMDNTIKDNCVLLVLGLYNFALVKIFPYIMSYVDGSSVSVICILICLAPIVETILSHKTEKLLARIFG